MPITFEDAGLFRFKMNQRLADFLLEHRIKTVLQGGVSRWKEGDEITASKSLRLQPHSTTISGYSLLALGCFTYTFSPLNPFVTVGRYCSISWNVRLMGPPHPVEYVSTSPVLFSKDHFDQSIRDFDKNWKYWPLDWSGGGPAKIGNDVWIGQDVLLGPKARLGDGCVIGAGAVVTGQVPPYAIFGGVPARLIRYRFDPPIIEALQALRWWDYALPELSGLPFNRPEAFVGEFRSFIERNHIVPYAPDLGRAYDLVRQMV